MLTVRACKYAVMVLVGCLLLGAGSVYWFAPALLERVVLSTQKNALVVAGQPLSFTDVSVLSVFPPAVQFSGVRLGSEQSVCTVAARQGRAQLSILSLLTGIPFFSEVSLDTPVLTYRGAPAPEALVVQQAADGSVRRPVRQPAGPGVPLGIERLVVRDGTVVVATSEGSRVKLSDLNLSAYNLTEDGKSKVECDFTASLQSTLGERREATLAISGGMAFSAAGLKTTALQVTVTPLSGPFADVLSPVSLSIDAGYEWQSTRFVLDKCLMSMQNVRGSLSGQGTVSPKLAFAGEMELGASQRKEKAAAAFLPAGMVKGRILLEDGRISLPEAEGRIGSIPVSGSLFYELEPGLLKGRGRCASADLNALLASFPSQGTSSGAAARKSRSMQPKDGDASSAVQMDLVLEADSVRYNDIVLEKAVVGAAGTRDKLRFAPLHAKIGETGRIDAMAEVSLPEFSWTYSAVLDNVPLASLLRLADSRAAMDGRADARIKGSLQGGTAKERLQTMSAEGTVNIHSLRSVEIERIIDAAFSGSSFSREALCAQPAAAAEDLGRAIVTVNIEQGEGVWEAGVTGSSVLGTGRGQFDAAADTIAGSLELHQGKKTVRLSVSGRVKEPVFAGSRE